MGRFPPRGALNYDYLIISGGRQRPWDVEASMWRRPVVAEAVQADQSQSRRQRRRPHRWRQQPFGRLIDLRPQESKTPGLRSRLQGLLDPGRESWTFYLAANSPPMFNPYSQLFDFIVIHFPAIHLQRKYLVSYSYFFLVPTKPVWANSYLGIHPVISWVFLEPAIFMPRSFASNQWYLPKSISVVL